MRRPFFTYKLSLLFLAFIANCSFMGMAQCSYGFADFNKIGPTCNNPFTAERVTESHTLQSDDSIHQSNHLEEIARNSKGFIRIERHNISTSSHTDSEGHTTTTSMDQVSIQIFNPENGTNITLIPLKKTAIIYEPLTRQNVKSAPHPYSAPWLPTLNHPYPANFHFEDLGTKTIEGVSARGGRTTNPSTIHEEQDIKEVIHTREWWISDELAAHVLEIITNNSTG